MYDAVIVHAGELCLKGGNRGLFERQLVVNLRNQLAGWGDLPIGKQQASFVITPAAGTLDAATAAEWRSRLRTVFGIAKFMFVRECQRDVTAIGMAATEVAREALTTAPVPPRTFKIITRRSDKSFPQDSMEVSRLVGGAVLDAVPELAVDVNAPQLVIRVEINNRSAFVSPDLEPGAGGLPVGVSGRLAALLSGGIDSPVAAWKVLRRGCAVTYVHFHSYPFVDRRSIEKVRRLAETLIPWQPEAALYLIPFGEFQREVTAKCDPALRIILYRRMMVRLAEAVAQRVGALGLVSGDSIGQVASQTLENMATVSAAATMPIYRPLVGEDKEDIITLAKRVGTYDIAIEPHDDCCSLFLPPRPATAASTAWAEREEAKIDLARLMQDALDRSETVIIKRPEEV